VLGEHAELGPLDVQIYEEPKAGKGEFNSALNLFKTLEQLQTTSVEALASAMQFIVDQYGMSYDESLTHAIAFVGATTGPLVGKLDPQARRRDEQMGVLPRGSIDEERPLDSRTRSRRDAKRKDCDAPLSR
jgi:hypothetical protein